MLHNLSLCSTACQVYLNKTGRKMNKYHFLKAKKNIVLISKGILRKLSYTIEISLQQENAAFTFNTYILKLSLLKFYIH